MLCVFPTMKKRRATLSRDFVVQDLLQAIIIWLMARFQRIGGKWLLLGVRMMALSVSATLRKSLSNFLKELLVLQRTKVILLPTFSWAVALRKCVL